MHFTKSIYEEIRLPFILDNNPEDLESGLISIEAYGFVFQQMKYCYATYHLKKQMYESEDYEQMINLLKNSAGKTVKVFIKIKKGIPEDFKIDINSLAEIYSDDRFKSLELVCWGFNDKSFREAELS